MVFVLHPLVPSIHKCALPRLLNRAGVRCLSKYSTSLCEAWAN